MGVAFWVAVIVVSPAPLTLTVPSTTSATNGFEDVYVQAPSDVELGGTRAKSGSFTTLEISAQPPRIGVPTTVKVIETDFGDANKAVGACVAVIVDVPGFKSEAVPPLIDATVGSEETKLHVPRDVEVGAWRTREAAT